MRYLFAFFVAFSLSYVAMTAIFAAPRPKKDPIPENCMETEQITGILERDGEEGFVNGPSLYGFKLSVYKVVEEQGPSSLTLERVYLLATTGWKMDEELRNLTKRSTTSGTLERPTITVSGVIGHRLKAAEIIVIKSYKVNAPKP